MDRQAYDIDRALKDLHGGPDAIGLAELHEEAAEIQDDPGARRFHLTQAWIFALVVGDIPKIKSLERTLKHLGSL